MVVPIGFEGFIFVQCFVVWFLHHISEEEIAGCRTLIVLLLSIFCVSSSRCLGLYMCVTWVICHALISSVVLLTYIILFF